VEETRFLAFPNRCSRSVSNLSVVQILNGRATRRTKA